MKRVAVLVATIASILLSAGQAARGAAPTGSLLSSGDLPMLHRASPGGAWTMEIVPIRGGIVGFDADAIVKGPGGETRRLTGLLGAPLFINDDGRLVTLTMIEGYPYPRDLCVYGPDGRLLYQRKIRFPVDPILSDDGTHFAIRIEEGILVVDLASLMEEIHPGRDLFVLGPRGILASSDGATLDVGGREFRLDRAARKIAFAADGALLVTSATDLERWDPATGVRSVLRQWPEVSGPQGAAQRDDPNGIPWPFHPDAQHSIGNSWGEYQNYGGNPYCHPGIDVFAAPGDSVFAVHSGIVKAVLTTGGDLYWRVAISDSVTSGTSRGYLYAHLIQSSIRVQVGDMVTVGQYIGNIVTWPIYNFHHCHFARIEDSGSTWGDGRWLAVENPQLRITHQNETSPPVFEPARGTDLFAFCANETSTYQSPTGLHGPIDIICHVGDTIASPWICNAQQINYTIYPLGMPDRPIVNNKESVYFNFASDEYQGGTNDIFLCGLFWKKDSTCNTQGDYDYREYYHIITNSNGDRNYTQSDKQECWDTSGLPDRQWVIKVTAVDVVGNTAVDSMIVRTLNGNPSDAPVNGLEAVFALDPGRPSPFSSGTAISFRLPSAADRVTLSILDPAGRVVRTLRDGGLAAGAHVERWDGRDARGADVPAGMYFYKLSTPWGTKTEKTLRVR